MGIYDVMRARRREACLNSLRSVGFAQSPELRPSGVSTTRRLLLRKYDVQRLVRLGSGATPAPRNCETNRIGFGRFYDVTISEYASCIDALKSLNPVRLERKRHLGGPRIRMKNRTGRRQNARIRER